MKRFLSLILCAAMIFTCMGTYAFADAAPQGGISGMENYLKYSAAFANDGYLDIPVDIYTYFGDKTNEKTPVMLYVINTNTKRTGTDSDETIVNDLVVNKGFVVVVIDYKNNSLAKSPDLDWSIQQIRTKITAGSYLSGALCDKELTYVLPSGYNILYNDIYWSIDKHGADGSLEKIVEVWNNDFSYFKGDMTITYKDGEVKKVSDITAESIYDCVNKDGSPVDLDLRMDIIYPTHPEKEVPVMCLVSSSETRVGSWTNPKRPHLTGFLFDGYAGVVYDYAYTPMARNDHYGYFDGNTFGISGDNYTYSLAVYNGIKSDSAAIRKIRYLSDADNDTYKFDVNKIGVYGNSKGGLCTRIGNPNFEKLPEQRYFEGHKGETRYEAVNELGKTDSYIGDGKLNDDGTKIIDDPELQPYLKYKDGTPIPSNAQFVYANCGGGAETIMEGNAPMYATGTMDAGGSYYDFYPQIVNACRTNDIPCLALANPGVGHAFGYGKDRDYGLDVYNEFRVFANYYLKDDNAVCEYIDPADGTDNVDTNTKITVKFTGPVSEQEIKKVVIKNASNGDIAKGRWEPSFGKTTWTFLANNLEGGYTYTVDVAKTITAENGKPLAFSKKISFKTAHEEILKAKNSLQNTYLSDENDKAFVYFDTDKASTSMRVYLRFGIANDAANTVEVYKVDEINETDLNSSVPGEKIGETVLLGKGNYTIDVTDYVKSLESEKKAAFMLKLKKAPGKIKISEFNFDGLAENASSVSEISMGGLTKTNVSSEQDHTTGSGKSAKISYFKRNGDFKNKDGVQTGNFVANPTIAANFDGAIKSGALTADDYGRRFNVSISVYDTTSRLVKFGFHRMVSGTVVDWNWRGNSFITKKDEWSTLSFDYTIDDKNYYGALQQRVPQLSCETSSVAVIDDSGSVSIADESRTYPLYYDDIIVTETITGVQFAESDTDDVISPSLVLHPTESESIYASDMAYASNGINKDKVMDIADSVYVSGRKTKISDGAKAYVKLSLSDFEGGSAAFSFTTDSNSCGKLWVYGIKDKDECANWSSKTINYTNAPANERTSDSAVDLKKVYGESAIASYDVNGQKTYSADITEYANYMKASGADYITLVFATDSRESKTVFYENFESAELATTFSQGGDPISRDKSDDIDHTRTNGTSYKFYVDSGYDRLRFDVSNNYLNLTSADVGRKFKVTFYAAMDSAGSFQIGSIASRTGVMKDAKTMTANEAYKWQKYEYILTATENAGWDKQTVDGKAAKYYQTGINVFANIEAIANKNGYASLDNKIKFYIDDITVEEITGGGINITPVGVASNEKTISGVDFNSSSEGVMERNNFLEDVNSNVNALATSGCDAKTILKISSDENYSGEGGKSMLFSPSAAHNRIKFYNTFDHALTKDDIGRTVRISFMLKSDTEGSFSYGMTSKLQRRVSVAGSMNKYEIAEGETPDIDANGNEIDYTSVIYKPKTGTISADEVGKWKKFTYDVTVDETMISKTVNVYDVAAWTNPVTWKTTPTYSPKTGVCLLSIFSDNFKGKNASTNVYANQPNIYIDDICTTEITESSSAPYAYIQGFENVTDGADILNYKGVFWAVRPGNTQVEQIDVGTIDDSESYLGGKSLKINCVSSGASFKFKNICAPLTESDNGKNYTVSFWAKSDRAGSFTLGMASHGSDTKYNDGLLQAQSYTVSESDVGVWKRYVYKFTVGSEQITDGATYLRLTSLNMGQSKVSHGGVKANGENNYWNYLDSEDPLTFYVDELISKEVSDTNETNIEITDKAAVGKNAVLSGGTLRVYAAEEKELSGIKKAYMRFSGGDCTYAEKAELYFDVTKANGKTFNLYAITKGEYENNFTYSNALGSNDDESVFTSWVYNNKPIAQFKADEAKTYSADITEYIKSRSPEDYIFMLTSDEVCGKEYLSLDFENTAFTKDTDYLNFGGLEECEAKDGALFVNADNFGEGIIVLNATGNSNETVKSGESYSLSAEIKNTSDTDARYTVALVNKDASYIASESCVNILKDSLQTIELKIDASKEDEQNGVCAVLIYSNDGLPFSADNIRLSGGSEIEIDRQSARIDLLVAKQNPTEDENNKTSITLATTGDCVTIDGEKLGASVTKEYEKGQILTLDAEGEAEFMYWKDFDCGLIVSYDKNFSFTVGSQRSLVAVYGEKDAAYVTFKNINGFVLAAGVSESICVPQNPYVYGYEFYGWYTGGKKADLKAGETVSASENTIYSAGFIKKDTLYKVSINGEEKDCAYNETVSVLAEDIKDNKAFSYWLKDGAVVSYDSKYSFYVSSDAVLEAVYGKEAQDKNVLVMANPVMADESRIAFFAERNISAEFEVIETGVLIGKTANLGLETAGVIKATSKSKDNKGQFTVRKKDVKPGDCYYGRAYVIYKNSSGAVDTIYSNEVSLTVK